MRSKLLMIISASVLLTACATESEESTASTSAGAVFESGIETESGVETDVVTQTDATPPKLPTLDPRSQEWLVVNVGDRVFFNYDKSNLSPEAAERVEALAVWMLSHPDVALTLEGHADERGTRDYNLALGERRANAVRSYMEALGVDPERVSVISYGFERPAVPGSNETAWSQNRRTTFVVDSSPRANKNSAQR